MSLFALPIMGFDMNRHGGGGGGGGGGRSGVGGSGFFLFFHLAKHGFSSIHATSRLNFSA